MKWLEKILDSCGIKFFNPGFEAGVNEEVKSYVAKNYPDVNLKQTENAPNYYDILELWPIVEEKNKIKNPLDEGLKKTLFSLDIELRYLGELTIRKEYDEQEKEIKTVIFSPAEK